MYDLQEHVTQRDEEAYETLIDAEKAFDLVNWSYMWAVLKHMGFGDHFIQWCQLLDHNTQVQLNINGWLQDPLRPGRGVKQGDPLSAMLFVLTIEPLANIIRARPDLGYIAHGRVATGSFFADDSVMFSSSVANASAQLDLVSTYCRGSGAKHNIAETKILTLNRRQNPPEDSVLRFMEPNESCRYLGLPIGQQIHDSERIAHINARFFATLTGWRWRARTLHGRKLLAHSVILSQLWYTTSVTSIRATYLKSWQRAISNYVLRAFTEPNEQRLPMDAQWLYTRPGLVTLKRPNIRTIVHRQRIQLLQQVTTSYTHDKEITWSTTARVVLNMLTGELGRVESSDFLWTNAKTKYVQDRMKNMSPWWRSVVETWYQHDFDFDTSDLTDSERYELHMKAPIWPNRHEPAPTTTHTANASPVQVPRSSQKHHYHVEDRLPGRHAEDRRLAFS